MRGALIFNEASVIYITTLDFKNKGPFNKLRGLINVFYPVPKGLAVEAYINLVSAKLELNTLKTYTGVLPLVLFTLEDCLDYFLKT